MSVGVDLLFYNVGHKKHEFIVRPYYKDNKKWETYRLIKIGDFKGIHFPGRGMSKPNCGTFEKAFICDCHETKRAIHHSCNDMDCPICYQKAINRSIKRVDYRFLKIKQAKHETMKSFRLRHFSFNTLWDITAENFKKYRTKMNGILKDQGMSGVLIFHPGRIKDEVQVLPWKTDPFKTKIVGEKILQKSGHWHFIGTGAPINVKEFKAKYGFNYTNISAKNYAKGDLKYPFIHNRRVLRNTLGYLLTHCGYTNGSHCYTWMGDFAYNKLRKVNVVEESEHVHCPACDGLVYLIKNTPIDIAGTVEEGFMIIFDHYITVDRSHCLSKKIKKYTLEFKT